MRGPDLVPLHCKRAVYRAHAEETDLQQYLRQVRVCLGFRLILCPDVLVEQYFEHAMAYLISLLGRHVHREVVPQQRTRFLRPFVAGLEQSRKHLECRAAANRTLVLLRGCR